MSALRKNVASQVLTLTAVNATTGAALTGATITTKVTLDGTQSASAGTLTELTTGQYKYVPTQGETNGTSVGFSFTATNMVPINLHCFTTAQDPTDAVRFGLTALPNANAEAAGGLYTRGSGAGQIAQSNNGRTDSDAKTIANAAIASATFAANAIDAAAIATDAIGASELAAGAATKIRDTILSDATTFAGASIALIKAKTDNLPEGIKKNTALNNFEFFMADSTDHVTGKTGLTVTGTTSIDGGVFAALTNAVTEVASGIYKVNLAAADVNGDVITLKFTAAGADATLITFKTSP